MLDEDVWMNPIKKCTYIKVYKYFTINYRSKYKTSAVYQMAIRYLYGIN